MSIRTVAEPATGSITDLQGQYLAFIYAYSKIHRASPAEADLQRFFEVSPPSVHRMVLELERNRWSVDAALRYDRDLAGISRQLGAFTAGTGAVIGARLNVRARADLGFMFDGVGIGTEIRWGHSSGTRPWIKRKPLGLGALSALWLHALRWQTCLVQRLDPIRIAQRNEA
jgi:hypothetical protein